MSIILSWVLPPILALFLGPLAATIYLTLLGSGRRGAYGRAFWPVAGLLTLALGLLIFYTFGDFFPGPGCFVSLVMPLGALLTFLFVRGQRRRLTPAGPALASGLRRLSWLLPLLLLGAPISAFAYGRACDALNRRAARPVIAALEAYRRQHGAYPQVVGLSDLTLLVPQYLAETPPIACALPGDRPAFGDDDWSLYPCPAPGGPALRLLVPILSSASVQAFDLSRGRWSVASAFDGYCRP